MRRVVITGIGVVTPIGINVEAFWQALVEGRSGIAPLSLFDPGQAPVQSTAEVKAFDARQFVKNEKMLNLSGRSFQFAMAAAQMAIDDAGLGGAPPGAPRDPARFGAALGVGSLNQYTKDLAAAMKASSNGSGWDVRKFSAEGIYKLYPLRRLTLLPNMVTSYLSILHNIQGPNLTMTTGEAASGQAIGEAFKAIARSSADIMLCGGTDSKIDPVTMAVYDHYNLLSRTPAPGEACRPLDRRRNGFVLGEGAGLLVLEELDHALGRGADIYAEVVGYGSSFAAQNGKGEEGLAESLAIERALKDAVLAPGDIDYVTAHAPGGVTQDRGEMKGLLKVFNGHGRAMPVTAIKSMVGNAISAAGALDLAATALAVKTGWIPPTVNFSECEFGLDVVAGTARPHAVQIAMSNSFAFSGHHVSLIVRKYPGHEGASPLAQALNARTAASGGPVGGIAPAEQSL